MVILFSVIGFMWLGAKIKSDKGEMNDALIKYNTLMDAKNRILSKECYGQVINEVGVGIKKGANDTCDFPPGVIKGYKIRMLEYQNCSNVTITWEHMFSDEDGDQFPYFIPIKDNETGNICPGRLWVIV